MTLTLGPRKNDWINVAFLLEKTVGRSPKVTVWQCNVIWRHITNFGAKGLWNYHVAGDMNGQAFSLNLFIFLFYASVVLKVASASFSHLCFFYITLFPKRNAGLIHPFFLSILGHWPWPRVMSILSNGLRSTLEKTPFKNFWCFPHNTKMSKDKSSQWAWWDHKTAQILLQSKQLRQICYILCCFWKKMYACGIWGHILLL